MQLRHTVELLIDEDMGCDGPQDAWNHFAHVIKESGYRRFADTMMDLVNLCIPHAMNVLEDVTDVTIMGVQTVFDDAFKNRHNLSSEELSNAIANGGTASIFQPWHYYD